MIDMFKQNEMTKFIKTLVIKYNIKGFFLCYFFHLRDLKMLACSSLEKLNNFSEIIPGI